MVIISETVIGVYHSTCNFNNTCIQCRNSIDFYSNKLDVLVKNSDRKYPDSQIKICSLNVCGLKSKLLNPDFTNLIESYDILIFEETKTSALDTIELPTGYLYFTKHRKLTENKSGGIVIVYKSSLSAFLHFINTESEFVQWVKIDKEIIRCSSNILLGCIYIPPENSKYASPEAINEIDTEMNCIAGDCSLISLIGDFNAKTGDLQDFTVKDEDLSQFLNVYDDVEFSQFMNDYDILKKNNIPLGRYSKCTSQPNTYGRKLIEFCKTNNLYIGNGRLGEDLYTGKKTCKNSTLVDYFILSSNIFELVDEFEVKDFDPMLSDVHCLIHISLFSRNTPKCENENVENNLSENFVKWKSDFESDYVELVSSNLYEVENHIDELCIKDLCQNDIDEVVDKLCNVLVSSAKETFGNSVSSKLYKKNRNVKQKPWFNKKCEKNRKIFHKAKAKYNRVKNAETRKSLKLKAKNYRKSLNLSYAKYKENFSNELRSASKYDSRKFWNILNKYSDSNRSKIPDVPLDEFYEFFKSINSYEEELEVADVPDPDIVVNNSLFEQLNDSISEEEIRKVVKKLANHKASGFDKILNE